MSTLHDVTPVNRQDAMRTPWTPHTHNTRSAIPEVGAQNDLTTMISCWLRTMLTQSEMTAQCSSGGLHPQNSSAVDKGSSRSVLLADTGNSN